VEDRKELAASTFGWARRSDWRALETGRGYRTDRSGCNRVAKRFKSAIRDREKTGVATFGGARLSLATEGRKSDSETAQDPIQSQSSRCVLQGPFSALADAGGGQLLCGLQTFARSEKR
jgi:hypothetical protein